MPSHTVSSALSVCHVNMATGEPSPLWSHWSLRRPHIPQAAGRLVSGCYLVGGAAAGARSRSSSSAHPTPAMCRGRDGEREGEMGETAVYLLDSCAEQE